MELDQNISMAVTFKPDEDGKIICRMELKRDGATCDVIEKKKDSAWRAFASASHSMVKVLGG